MALMQLVEPAAAPAARARKPADEGGKKPRRKGRRRPQEGGAEGRKPPPSRRRRRPRAPRKEAESAGREAEAICDEKPGDIPGFFFLGLIESRQARASRTGPVAGFEDKSP